MGIIVPIIIVVEIKWDVKSESVSYMITGMKLLNNSDALGLCGSQGIGVIQDVSWHFAM